MIWLSSQWKGNGGDIAISLVKGGKGLPKLLCQIQTTQLIMI